MEPTIGAGLPQPAMQPLHPDKSERSIVRGDVWTKRASQRNTDKRPTARIQIPGRKVHYIAAGEYCVQLERTFRRDWE